MIKQFNFAGKALLFSLFFLLIFNQSCTNLDEKIFSELTEDNFPTTEEQFISALGATYTSLYGLAGHNSIFALQEVSSDEAMIPHRGADWFDGGQWIRVHRHEYNAREESVNNGWNFLYGGVNNCNRVIDLFSRLVQEGKVDPALASGFIAEVRTLRALFYYWLLDGYGNVPIVTSFADADPNPRTRPRAEVFEFIERELNESVPQLARLKDGSTYARMNFYAGRFLQAKLYLNSEAYTGKAEWARVIAACDDIINSGLYDLESNYFNNFNTNNAGSKENILVIPYDEQEARGFNLAQMTLHYQSQATFRLQQQPWNGYCTLQEFYQSYEDGDARKGVSGNQQIRGNFLAGPQFDADGNRLIDSGAEANDPDGQPLTFTPEVNELEPNALRQAGARIAKYEYALGSTPDLNVDFPIFRYADVLLMKAEAQFRTGAAGPALTLVNQIRQRAGVAAFATLTADNLLAERGREMFYEGWRRQDLIRFGRYNAPWRFKPASTPQRNIFPIPINQISANPNLQQNPGY
ncbi:MAG TPA: RagB/SusD family nutrient uptake outer membrane protein [Saprospiraceae bacterium]|nr:RagB/SusD family nutrient uptake outer membrane protein [Saprospiraceae bacterium]HMP13425.1 RagB/SusD family nutrient uptake outer membrane protein [Saprospiraceae bacterium]